jgi:23S rRNA (guanosine2251-2'-O)-methyltransferase
LSRLVREACDVEVSIGPAAGAESLNVSVAVGVALYAVATRRRAAGRL